jgi:hypothetical protein
MLELKRSGPEPAARPGPDLLLDTCRFSARWLQDVRNQVHFSLKLTVTVITTAIGCPLSSVGA